VSTIQIAGAQGAHFPAQHLLDDHLRGEVVPNVIGIRVIDYPATAIYQIGAAALANAQPRDVAV
jgi:hypothetical protein